MYEHIEVVYEGGVLRPVGVLPAGLREHQRLTVTLGGPAGAARHAGSQSAAPGLEAVRAALARAPGTLAAAARAERDER